MFASKQRPPGGRRPQPPRKSASPGWSFFASKGSGRAPVAKRREAAVKQPEAVPVNPGFHRRALARAWRQFHEGSLSHWITTTVIALSLTIYGAFTLFLANANTLLEKWRGDNLVTVFMEVKAGQGDTERIQERLRGMPGVGAVTLVTPVAALSRMKGMLGSEAGLVDGLEENPLPFSLEFQGAPEQGEAITAMARQVESWPGVEAVAYDMQWAERLAAIVRVFRFTGNALSALLLSAVALIISNTIKLTIIARREEVEVMRFMGATDGFIKTPFIYEGVLQGLLGALISLMLTSLLFLGAQEAARELGQAFGFHFRLHHLPWDQLAIILALGVSLGLVGAVISVSRFLKV